MNNKNGKNDKHIMHIFIAVQFVVMMCLLAFIIVLISGKNGGLSSRHVRIFLSAFCIVISGIVIGAGLQMRTASGKELEELRIKEEKHRDEMNAILYTISENSAIITVDITDDKIISYHGPREQLIKKYEDGSTGAMRTVLNEVTAFVRDQEQKDRLSDILDVAKLNEHYSANEKELSVSFYVRMPDGSVEVRNLVLRMLQNAVNENIEAVIQVNDISDEYYKGLVGSYLAMKQFKFTTLIFINSGRGRSLANNSDMGKENKFYEYDFFRRDIYNQLIDVNERDEFHEKIALYRIKEELEKAPSYAVYVHGISETGEKRYIKYEFQYIDDIRETVLLCVADETSIWEVDMLTGMNNYKGFISQASNILEKSGENDDYSILVTNIKWFKVINKIFGRAKCDEFLREYSEKIQNSSLKPVVTGRFPASDHFIMLIRRENLDTDEIVRLSHQRIETSEREVDVLVTCGIYNVSDKKGSVSAMVEHAIMAYKGIKDVYNIPYATFSELEEERYLSGKLVVSGFDKALRDREFQPYYQPIYDAVTHEVVSAEALVRWKKDGSLIPPGMFIPALEENGSVSRVDLYISERVTELLKKRKSDGKTIVPVSVNLSVMDFYATDTIDGVMKDIQTMVDHSIVPRYEITETAWADASDNRNEIIENMRAKGTQILIDDFGSGYSSFSTIRDFSFDILKIDMGFIRKIGLSQKADGIVSSIIDMAHFIGLKVVAEGVETKEHLDFLTEHGCDYIQGYYFSKPLPEDEFEKLLDEQQTA